MLRVPNGTSQHPRQILNTYTTDVKVPQKLCVPNLGKLPEGRPFFPLGLSLTSHQPWLCFSPGERPRARKTILKGNWVVFNVWLVPIYPGIPQIKMSHITTSYLQMISFKLESQKETKSIHVEAGRTQTTSPGTYSSVSPDIFLASAVSHLSNPVQWGCCFFELRSSDRKKDCAGYRKALIFTRLLSF